jgi:hypothetical protein
MQDYAFRVRLTATVRVRAADEIVARRAATSVLLSLSADDIGIANDRASRRDRNAALTKTSFSVEGRPMLVAIDGKRIKRSRPR